MPLLLWGCGGPTKYGCEEHDHDGEMIFPPRCGLEDPNCGGFHDFDVGVRCDDSLEIDDSDENPPSLDYCARKCRQSRHCTHFFYTLNKDGSSGKCRGCTSAPEDPNQGTRGHAVCSNAYAMGDYNGFYYGFACDGGAAQCQRIYTNGTEPADVALDQCAGLTLPSCS
eukprot:TRINITY_DN96748_c0_g1_i1.p1 TRINITY_DN96748_c0_g1~~TRINITY_DN96748_c0_g1_i1.p1  ORF type:complete len:195 (+),score=25.27 TRINITY_DN96748_c0_g1_i1:83-586(+)